MGKGFAILIMALGIFLILSPWVGFSILDTMWSIIIGVILILIGAASYPRTVRPYR